MKQIIIVSVLLSLFFCSSNTFSKDWYEKGCTPSGKDPKGNYYVGGPVNKFHIHAGSDFISFYSHNSNAKMNNQTKCAAMDQAIQDVSQGEYLQPGNVTACLIYACGHFIKCEWRGGHCQEPLP